MGEIWENWSGNGPLSMTLYIAVIEFFTEISPALGPLRIMDLRSSAIRLFSGGERSAPESTALSEKRADDFYRKTCDPC